MHVLDHGIVVNGVFLSLHSKDQSLLGLGSFLRKLQTSTEEGRQCASVAAVREASLQVSIRHAIEHNGASDQRARSKRDAVGF